VAWGSGQCGRPHGAAALVFHVMSRDQLRELMVLFVVGPALTRPSNSIFDFASQTPPQRMHSATASVASA
jgi:hypothetical protein